VGSLGLGAGRCSSVWAALRDAKENTVRARTSAILKRGEHVIKHDSCLANSIAQTIQQANGERSLAGGSGAQRSDFATQRIQALHQILVLLLTRGRIEPLNKERATRLEFANVNLVKILKALTVDHF